MILTSIWSVNIFMENKIYRIDLVLKAAFLTFYLTCLFVVGEGSTGRGDGSSGGAEEVRS